MQSAIGARLSAMMFLQFFIWGAWYVTIGNYMAAQGMADLTHWPYTVNPVAAIVAPFFLGLVADRFFATERVLGALHIVGGLIMLTVPQATGSPLLFILLLLLYNICYMPTLGLANSLAFHNIRNQEKQFPLIRVFGTIGWIVAGLFIGFVLGQFSGDELPDRTPLPLYTTAIASLILGAYSFTLPHTPPPAAGEKVSMKSIVGVDAFRQLGSRAFYIFIACSILICIPLAAYYNFAPIFVANAVYDQNVSNAVVGLLPNPSSLMTLGQMSEAAFMLLMPLLFARFGVKWMLAIGMAAWILRYLLFALGAPDAVFWMVVTGILLHGICYDFFFVTGQIYVDKKSTPAVRGQAQGFLVLVTYGVGMFIGAQIAGALFNAFLGDESVLTLARWQDFWLLPAGFALVVFLLFVFTFRDE
ncbi:MAG: nucleoside permease [Gammaproteobacteria bacterium]|nr:nucleoside permease [Gammaproteobacteria bacterium]MYA66679.1 nucleoside permease [Gammaproteobacteria bacterium]MYH45724.1 nucleoside permease [Gammaproteobacteria bacterium]MYH84953.1 nucleoside permease [Gammaproteobacteria bacterium]MYK04796.1 nucleoside permease [Gammaproteobacteria bacterium]